MAIINSLAIGKSVKSAGNLTYKTIRGRTIASQRITKNSSNTLLQSSQRTTFGMATKVAAFMQQYIDATYEKSKYGSARNHFMSINKGYIWGGVYSEVSEGAIPLDDVFVSSFCTPYVPGIGLRYSTYGTSPVITREKYSEKIWNDSASNQFTVKFTNSIDYILPVPIAPDKAEFIVAGIFPVSETLPDFVFQVKSFTLSSTNIAELLKMGIKVVLTLNDAQEIISIAVTVTEANMHEGYQAYCIGFLRYQSKIPKLVSIMDCKQAVAP